MTSDHWTRCVNRVMDHVRADPTAPHSLDDLAAVAHSSAYHFHRIFRAVTGETVGNFVQRARLERAAYLMKASPSKTLTVIAHETGFASSQDFSRAFRRTYGTAPSRWDRQSRLMAPVGRAEHRATPAKDLPVRVVQRGPIRLAYVRVRPAFPPPNLIAGLARLTDSLAERGVPWRDAQLVGLSWDNYETTPMDRLSYDLGIEVPSDVNAAGEFGIHELDRFDAVEIECNGPMQLIADAWDHLYETWFPAADREPADLPAMKWFRRPAGAMRDDEEWRTWHVACSIALRQRP